MRITIIKITIIKSELFRTKWYSLASYHIIYEKKDENFQQTSIVIITLFLSIFGERFNSSK